MANSMRVGGRRPTSGHSDDRGELRVFALQYRIDLSDGVSYESFRSAMRELMDVFVAPHLVHNRPTLVVFPEAIGLIAAAIGTRGDALRQRARTLAPPLRGEMPQALFDGLVGLGAAYLPQLAAYSALFGAMDPRSQLFVGLTDTSVRSFSTTFSDIARDYGVYVVAGNYQTDFRETTEPAEVAAYGDPELNASSAFVATSASVRNITQAWAPVDSVTFGPLCHRNVIASNAKIPLTSFELEFLGLDPGPRVGDEAIANASPVEIEGFRVGFATSLPAFTYGYPFAAEAATDPLADLEQSYAAAQSALGVEIMVQADANPGPWATRVANGSWQPLEWMGSTWRAVADRTVRFRYNITPMMTGNLLDLPFDGQSSITARGLSGDLNAHFVGNSAHGANDLPEYLPYAGAKPEFLALAPWVVDDAPRSELEEIMLGLLPGTGSPIENSYVETAIFADLLR